MPTLLRDNTGTGLTPNQVIYVNAIVADTGLSPRVVAAWTRREAGGADALKYEARKDFNYLNIGKTDSGFMRLTRDSIWKNPADAGHMTAAFILGTTYKGHRYRAGARIPEIKLTAGKSDEEQIRAIVRSGWATSPTYERIMRRIYAEIRIPEGPPEPQPKEILHPLVLTSPYTHGNFVRRVQLAVNRNSHANLDVDEQAGPLTFAGIRSALHNLGLSNGRLRRIEKLDRVPVGALKLLLGVRKPWPLERARAKSRAKKPPASSGAQQAVAWARTQVGVRERPPGSNRGPIIDQWQRAVGMQGQPWCGAFVHAASKTHSTAKGLTWRTRYVPYIVQDAKAGRNGYASWHPPQDAKPGDHVCYDWQGAKSPSVEDHVGLVVDNPPGTNDLVQVAIDGNRGDRVDHWRTSFNVIAGVARPRY